MKLYRNHYSTEGGCSGGFGWFTAKRAAEKAAREVGDEKPLLVAEPFKIERSRAGIVRFLNIYGSHPGQRMTFS